MRLSRIYCCGCECEVNARLTLGKEIYPHSKDLGNLPFWKCDKCGNYVGCHHKTKNRTKPLGNIPTPEMRDMRRAIHRILDPLWKSGVISRTKLYKSISDAIGYPYHTADLKTVEDAKTVMRVIESLSE